MTSEIQDVLVVGAGPTGLTLAGALRTFGVGVTLIESNPTLTPYTKATNLMQGTQEQLALFGVMERMKVRAGAMQNYMMSAYGTNLSPRDMHLRESPFCDVLFLGQNLIEENLGGWLKEIGQPIEFAHRLVSLTQYDNRVEAVVSHEGRETHRRFRYVVGCDGPRSLVRRGTKCDFQPVRTGKWVRQIDAKLNWKRLNTMKQMWLFYYDVGFAAVLHLPGGLSKFMTFEKMQPNVAGEPTLEYMEQRLRTISGDDSASLHDPTWISHGELLTGVAPTFIDGRIILAGDAGNPILPNGGQGLNIGIQDAINLAWKLSDVLKGYGSPSLLTSYETERRALRLSLEKAQRFVLEKTIDAPLWFRLFFRYLGNTTFDYMWPSIARIFSQLSHNYKRSPLSVDKMRTKGVSAGDRIVDADVVAASNHKEVSLFAEILDPFWKCLIFDAGRQIEASALTPYQQLAWIKTRVLTASTHTSYPTVSLYYDIDLVAHKRYSVNGATLLLIRPDNYVALRIPVDAVSDYDAYLERWFLLPK